MRRFTFLLIAVTASFTPVWAQAPAPGIFPFPWQPPQNLSASALPAFRSPEVALASAVRRASASAS